MYRSAKDLLDVLRSVPQEAVVTVDGANISHVEVTYESPTAARVSIVSE